MVLFSFFADLTYCWTDTFLASQGEKYSSLCTHATNIDNETKLIRTDLEKN